MKLDGKALVFLAGKRTPFGANGGALRAVHPVDLALHASRAALEQSGLTPDVLDHVIYGSVLSVTPDAIYLPRHLGLRLGIPQNVPALGINRLCGTGFQVLIEAQQQFAMGDSHTALVGGVENMSMAPYLLLNARWGMKMGHQQIIDSLLEGLSDSFIKMPMAITAENLAERYNISRAETDAFALLSQHKTESAQKEGRFAGEIVPMEKLTKDEHPRPGSAIENLSRLKPVFKKDGVVTAGNASGIVDGAASLIVTTEEFAQKKKLSPIGKLSGYCVVGCDPTVMGIGPVPAIRGLLERTGKSLDEIDLIEVNEAFAPQAVSVAKELKIPAEKFNVNGGAIAIGHPLAASGARITMQLLYELRRRKKKWGIGSACIGGGQGIAVLIEAF